MPDLRDTDLEQRLREDAARSPKPVPDFADSLQVAAAPRTAGRHHGRLVAAAAAVVVIAGVAAAGGSGVLSTRHDGPARRTEPTPATRPGDAPPLRLVGAITEPDSDAPTQLMVVSYSSTKRCMLGPPDVRVTETSTQVRVRITIERIYVGSRLGPPAERIPINAPHAQGSSQPLSRSASTESPAFPCANRAGYSETVTGLHTPLGRRTIVDADTGRPVPVLDRPAPEARYLPTGYRDLTSRSGDPMSAAPLRNDPGAYFPLAIARFYANSAYDRLEVVTAAADATLPGARIVGHEAVDGHAADETVSRGARCVTWQVAPGDGRQVCSVPQTRHPALSFDELTRVARSLTG